MTARTTAVPDARPLLTEQELADHLQVSVKTLQDWRYRSTGPEVTRVGRRVRYRWTAVEKYLDANTGGAR
jgi:predicted site-specific integrase-resolvase